jgi:hypothetical protein
LGRSDIGVVWLFEGRGLGVVRWWRTDFGMADRIQFSGSRSSTFITDTV